jgi:hypothetical protein
MQTNQPTTVELDDDRRPIAFQWKQDRHSIRRISNHWRNTEHVAYGVPLSELNWLEYWQVVTTSGYLLRLVFNPATAGWTIVRYHKLYSAADSAV